MSKQTLEATAQAMVAKGKGIFAADTPLTRLVEGCWGPLEEPSEAGGRHFQEMAFRTPGLNKHISSIILAMDIIGQKGEDGTSLIELINQQGILAGVTPSTGRQPIGSSPEEVIPTGLDGLAERLANWHDMGISFVKWRVGARVGPGLPTSQTINAISENVAEYAIIAQNAGLVPIVEPDVEMKGDHDIKRHFEVSEWFMHRVFDALYERRVNIEGIIIKTNMILSGSECPVQANPEQVAVETVKCLRRTVPAAVPGIGFLSGGQSCETATIHLNAINQLSPQPWAMSFSFGRAFGWAVVNAWDGKIKGSAGQKALLHRAKMNGMATLGQWTPELEKTG